MNRSNKIGHDSSATVEPQQYLDPNESEIEYVNAVTVEGRLGKANYLCRFQLDFHPDSPTSHQRNHPSNKAGHFHLQFHMYTKHLL